MDLCVPHGIDLPAGLHHATSTRSMTNRVDGTKKQVRLSHGMFTYLLNCIFCYDTALVHLLDATFEKVRSLGWTIYTYILTYTYR